MFIYTINSNLFRVMIVESPIKTHSKITSFITISRSVLFISIKILAIRTRTAVLGRSFFFSGVLPSDQVLIWIPVVGLVLPVPSSGFVEPRSVPGNAISTFRIFLNLCLAASGVETFASCLRFYCAVSINRSPTTGGGSRPLCTELLYTWKAI